MATLGIDIGTSGVRTAVLDGDRQVSSARADHPTQDSDALDATKWWEAVCSCLHNQISALRQIGFDPLDIMGIAVDGTSGSMVMVDADLIPVSPALMYNSKGFHDAAALIEKYAPIGHITRGTNSALARAVTLAGQCDRPAKHLLHQADYIAAKLMGRGGLSDDNNALKTGFDPETRTWPNWIGEVIDTDLLPDVSPPGTALFPLCENIVQTFGLAATARVHAGTTDSTAAFLACAPLELGAAVTSLGSTLAIKILSPNRIDDSTVGLYSHRLGDFWLVGGASNTGGAVLKSFFDAAQLVDLSAQIDLDTPTDLDFYPLLEPGERFPVNDPSLAPRLTPRPENDVAFLHGMLEAMARIEAACYREIQKRGGPSPTVIQTAGGGGQNPTWTRIRARAVGVPIDVPKYSEASVGAARLACSL